jgi:hypothetical protein
MTSFGYVDAFPSDCFSVSWTWQGSSYTVRPVTVALSVPSYISLPREISIQIHEFQWFHSHRFYMARDVSFAWKKGSGGVPGRMFQHNKCQTNRVGIYMHGPDYYSSCNSMTDVSLLALLIFER